MTPTPNDARKRDRFLARYDELNADLLQASPTFLSWRERVVDTSWENPLVLPDGVRVVFAPPSWILFAGPESRPGLGPTRVALHHARDPGCTCTEHPDTGAPARLCTPIPSNHGGFTREHFSFSLDTRHGDLQTQADLVQRVTGVTVYTSRNDWFVRVPYPCHTPAGRAQHPRLPRRDLHPTGRTWYGHVGTDGRPLGVLLGGPRSNPTHLWVDGTAVAITDLGLDHFDRRHLVSEVEQASGPPMVNLVRALQAERRWNLELRATHLLHMSHPEVRARCEVCRAVHTVKYGMELVPIRHRICETCRVVSSEGDASLPIPDIDRLGALLTEVAAHLGHVPAADWRRNLLDPDRDPDTRVALTRLAVQLPPTAVLTAAHGSWTHVLVHAGVLPGGTRRTSRGIRTISTDGHLCHSLGERLIDDWLAREGVPHEREPLYPGTTLRGDFLVNGTIVEYFGLAGDPTYDAKIARKRAIADAAGLTLVEVYPHDLADWDHTRPHLARQLHLPLS